MEPTLKLFSAVGTGSTLVEAMLTFKKIPYEIEAIDYEAVCANDPRIATLNPLSQLPTLLLTDGRVMTESAAIALYVESLQPEPSFTLKPDHADYHSFLRWLVFIVAAIYPTFSYGDDPSKWVKDEKGQKDLGTSTIEHRKKLWKMMEDAASKKGAWFFGDTFTVIDIYLGVMLHWRPRKEWFKKNCPALARIAENAKRHPALNEVIERGFS